MSVRIGIDARELRGRPTGVGRYLSGLARIDVDVLKGLALTSGIRRGLKGFGPYFSEAG